MIDNFDNKILSQTEKYVFSFASLFSNIYVYRNGGYILVPLMYASNSKIYDIANHRDLTKIFDKQFDLRGLSPSLSYEIYNPFMDENRQLQRTNSDEFGTWNPTPLTLDVRIYGRAKTKSEILQIFESIVPMFQSNINLNVNIDDDHSVDINIKMVDTEMLLPMSYERKARTFEEFTIYFHIDVEYYRIKKDLSGKELDFEIITEKNDFLEGFIND